MEGTCRRYNQRDVARGLVIQARSKSHRRTFSPFFSPSLSFYFAPSTLHMSINPKASGQPQKIAITVVPVLQVSKLRLRMANELGHLKSKRQSCVQVSEAHAPSRAPRRRPPRTSRRVENAFTPRIPRSSCEFFRAAEQM